MILVASRPSRETFIPYVHTHSEDRVIVCAGDSGQSARLRHGAAPLERRGTTCHVCWGQERAYRLVSPDCGLLASLDTALDPPP